MAGLGGRIQGTGGNRVGAGEQIFWRSEVLPARLLFATNPHTIPETTQNTSRFLTHPQQRPRMPQKEVLEESSPGRFLTEESSLGTIS